MCEKCFMNTVPLPCTNTSTADLNPGPGVCVCVCADQGGPGVSGLRPGPRKHLGLRPLLHQRRQMAQGTVGPPSLTLSLPHPLTRLLTVSAGPFPPQRLVLSSWRPLSVRPKVIRAQSRSLSLSPGRRAEGGAGGGGRRSP